MADTLRAVEEVLDDRKAEDGPSIMRRVELLCDVAGESIALQASVDVAVTAFQDATRIRSQMY